MHFTNNQITTKFGYINYRYYDNCDEYPNGLIVDLGAYVYKKYRKQGKLKEILKILFLRYPEGTKVQMAVKNKKLISMFKRMNFDIVKSIEYWGELQGTTLMQSIITKNIINLMYEKI